MYGPRSGGRMQYAVTAVPGIEVMVVVGSSGLTVTECHVPFCAFKGSMGFWRFVDEVQPAHVPPTGSHWFTAGRKVVIPLVDRAGTQMEARRKSEACPRHRGQCANASPGRDPPTFIFINDRRSPEAARASVHRRRAHHMMEARRRTAPTARDRCSFVSLDPPIQLRGFSLHLLRTASKFLDRLHRASLPRSHLLPERNVLFLVGRWLPIRYTLPFRGLGRPVEFNRHGRFLSGAACVLRSPKWSG